MTPRSAGRPSHLRLVVTDVVVQAVSADWDYWQSIEGLYAAAWRRHTIFT